MSLKTALKNFKWGYLLIAIVLCAAGVCFLAFPKEAVKTSSYIISGCSLIVGLTIGIKYLINKNRGFVFGLAMFAAGSTIITSIVGFIIPEKIFALYPMFIGLFFVMDGSFKLQTVINAKRYKLKMWWFLLSFSILTIAGGFLMIRLRIGNDIKINGFIIIMGIAFILSATENFLSLFFLGKITKRAKNEIKMELESKKKDEPSLEEKAEENVEDNTEITDDEDKVLEADILASDIKEEEIIEALD